MLKCYIPTLNVAPVNAQTLNLSNCHHLESFHIHSGFEELLHLGKLFSELASPKLRTITLGPISASELEALGPSSYLSDIGRALIQPQLSMLRHFEILLTEAWYKLEELEEHTRGVMQPWDGGNILKLILADTDSDDIYIN